MVPLAPRANTGPSFKADVEMLKMEVSDILTQPAVFAEQLWHQRYEDLDLLDYEMLGDPVRG